MYNPDMFKGLGFFIVAGMILTPIVAIYVVWKIVSFLYTHIQWVSP